MDSNCNIITEILLVISVTYVGRNSTVSTGYQGPAKESVSL